MPSLSAISTIDFEFKNSQQEVKEYARALFQPGFPQVERLMSVFDNTEIRYRNFCKPLSWYSGVHSFREQNDEYTRIALEYSVRAIEACMHAANVDAGAITDILFDSTTGLATPSLDALINTFAGRRYSGWVAQVGLRDFQKQASWPRQTLMQ